VSFFTNSFTTSKNDLKMNDKQLPLVTFEQAKRLKATGFDWETIRYFHVDGQFLDDDADKYEYNWNSPDVKALTRIIFGDNHPDEADVCSAPTVALALQWAQDVKGIISSVIPTIIIKNGNRVRRWLYCVYYVAGIDCKASKFYDTHEAADSALLDELLTIFENGK
jgi:hypothetical protein